ERRAVAGDPAEPEPGAAVRVRDLLEASLLAVADRRAEEIVEWDGCRLAKRPEHGRAAERETDRWDDGPAAGDVLLARLCRQLRLDTVREREHRDRVAAHRARREPGDERTILREGRDPSVRSVQGLRMRCGRDGVTG